MESERTPGTWHAHVDEPRKNFDTDEVYAATGERAERVCRMTGDVKHAYHDARLIAEAPEMLETLRCIVDWYDALEEPQHAPNRIDLRARLLRARAAIAKATSAPRGG